MFEPKHLKRWTRPDHYAGAVWPAYYSAGVGQSRDSDALERSNFTCMLRELGGESETVTIVRESHWLVGWVEWIAIHQDDEKSLRIADDIASDLEAYPVIDDDHYSHLEYTEAADYWNGLTPRERVEFAIEQRRRYHWLADKPVWFLGRCSYADLQDYESSPIGSIVQAIEESLRS